MANRDHALRGDNVLSLALMAASLLSHHQKRRKRPIYADYSKLIADRQLHNVTDIASFGDKCAFLFTFECDWATRILCSFKMNTWIIADHPTCDQHTCTDIDHLAALSSTLNLVWSGLCRIAADELVRLLCANRIQSVSISRDTLCGVCCTTCVDTVCYKNALSTSRAH